VKRALVVDDEPFAREEMCALLAATGEFAVIGECANAIEALQAIRREKPDVLFLDVQMPVVSGFELLAMLEDELVPLVVFVTAHDEFALRAFDENALDYLLKPVSRERLARAIDRIRRFSGSETGERPAYAGAEITRIPCSGSRSVRLVAVADVELVKSGPGGVYVVGPGGELFTELTLRVLEDRAGLLRCHKQFLVNTAHVEELTVGDNQVGVVRTRSGHQVPVSRRHLVAVKTRLGI
jgi:two-component system, LytTR family, response regulator